MAVDLSWQAELIRFSAFPPPSVLFKPAPLWESLVGSAPEDIQERPQQATRVESGPLGPLQFVISQQPGRFDLWCGIRPERIPADDFVSVGPYAEVAGWLVPLVRQWLERAPTLGRIAFAPAVLIKVGSQQEAYRLLQTVLPKLPLDPEHSQNLIWQINRPRQSKVIEGFAINRFSNWTALRRDHVELMASNAGNVLASNAQSFAVRLLLDIYSDPIAPLPTEATQSLLNEMVAAAEEIMTNGDIP